jgi:hypothetical protein
MLRPVVEAGFGEQRDSWRVAPVRIVDHIHTYAIREIAMPPSKRAAPRRPDGRRGKVRKEFWLDPKALRRAQAVLGAATERETVELALDIVAFRDEVQAGVRALDGLKLDRRA